MATAQEIPNPFTPENDAGLVARAAKESAREKMLRDSQAAKPLTEKEKTTLGDTAKLADAIVKTFTDTGTTPDRVKTLLNEFVNAKDNAGRAKVFTDNNMQQPQVVTDYEAKYGAQTTDAIRNSVLLAQRVEQEKKTAPADRTRATETEPKPSTASVDEVAILNQAGTAINNSMNTLRATQPDGKPLADSAKEVFQAAIDATAKITQPMIDAQKQALYNSIPGWTQAKEAKFLALNNDIADASNNLSPAAQANLARLPQNASYADTVQAVTKMADTDPSAKKLSDSFKATQDFYNSNPSAKQRIALDPQFESLERLSHGKAITSTVYGEALSKTGNAGDITQAKAMMTEAAKDKSLIDVMPDIQNVYDKIMKTTAQTSSEKPGDPLDKTIPGRIEAKAALVATDDQSLTPEQRMAKAAPLFETALKAAKSINPAAIQDDETKNIASQQGMIVSQLYAQALTQTASDLRTEANREPANSSKLNAEANAMTEKATTVLNTLAQTDHNFSEGRSQTVALNQKRVQEEIAQANRGEVIDLQKAAGVGGAQLAMGLINEAAMGKVIFGINPAKMARPFTTVANPAIDALDFADAHLPVVGLIPGGISSTLGYVMSVVNPSASEYRPDAIEALTDAKVADPVAAKAVVEQKEQTVLQNAVSLGNDIVSGQIGVLGAKFGPELLAKLPQLEETAFKIALEHGSLPIKAGAGVIAGVGLAFGSRWAMDELSHGLLGSKRMSVAELATHSTAALTAAYTARGLSSAMPWVEKELVRNSLRTAVTSAATSAAFGLGEVNPFVTNQATGRNYTMTDTMLSASQNLGYGGVGGVIASGVVPVMKLAGNTGISKLFNPQAGERIFSSLSRKAVVQRAVGGFAVGAVGDLLIGAKQDGNDNDLSWGQRAQNAVEYGALFSLGTSALPAVAIPTNAIRGYIGRTGVTFGKYVAGEGSVLGDNVVAPLTAFGRRTITAAAPEGGQFVRSHALQLSTALSGFYQYSETRKIDRLSDAAAEEKRKKLVAH